MEDFIEITKRVRKTHEKSGLYLNGLKTIVTTTVDIDADNGWRNCGSANELRNPGFRHSNDAI